MSLIFGWAWAPFGGAAPAADGPARGGGDGLGGGVDGEGLNHLSRESNFEGKRAREDGQEGEASTKRPCSRSPLAFLFRTNADSAAAPSRKEDAASAPAHGEDRRSVPAPTRTKYSVPAPERTNYSVPAPSRTKYSVPAPERTNRGVPVPLCARCSPAVDNDENVDFNAGEGSGEEDANAAHHSGCLGGCDNCGGGQDYAEAAPCLSDEQREMLEGCDLLIGIFREIEGERLRTPGSAPEPANQDDGSGDDNDTAAPFDGETFDRDQLRLYSDANKIQFLGKGGPFTRTPLKTSIAICKIILENYDHYKENVKGKWDLLSQEEKDALDVDTNPSPTDKFLKDTIWKAIKEEGISFRKFKRLGDDRFAVGEEVTEFWKKKVGGSPRDSGSIRQYLISPLQNMGQRETATARREYVAKEARKIKAREMKLMEEAQSVFKDAGTAKLGSNDGSIPFVPQYEKPEGAEADETKETYEKVMKEVEAEAKRQRTAASESGGTIPEEDAKSPNLHKTMFCMLVQYAALFQFLLVIDAAAVPCAFALLISTIATYTGFAIEELAELRGYSDHAERWAKDWKAMLLEITSSLLRKLCVQCNVCHRRPGDDRSTLFGWHLDHLLKFWKKDKAVSEMSTVRAMVKEALKTCLACSFCHEQGRPNPDYPQRLGYKSKLQYFFGTAHRTVRAILAFKEVIALILDLRLRGAFGRTEELPCSWQTLVVVVWMHLGIFLEDLIYFREDDWKNARDKRYRIALAIVREILKKLSVRCPNPECPEWFANMIPARTSGIHLNHQLADGEKTDAPCEALKKGVDAYLFELVRGDCDGTCACCHGIINALQKKRRSMTDALSWAKPSLR